MPAILRSQRTYPLTLKAPAQYAINAGIVSAYDFQGDPNSAYALGNGVPHVGTRTLTHAGATPTLVAVDANINGRDPSVGKTLNNPYQGCHIGPMGWGSADGKGSWTIHRRMRMPMAHSGPAPTRSIASYKDAGNTKVALYVSETATYMFFKWELQGGDVVVPSNSSAGNAPFRVNFGAMVDVHLTRSGDTVSFYLNGVLAASATAPTLTTFNTDWAGSAGNIGYFTAPPTDLVLIDEKYWNRALSSTEVSQHFADPYAGYANSAVVPDGVTITNPLTGSQVNSEGIQVAGSYSGATVPTGIEARFAGGAWAALTGLTIAGGNYSGTTPAVAPGVAATLEVRFANATAITASVANITAQPPAPTVAITSQPPPDGQAQRFVLATTRATSVNITLVAAGNGAITQGPTNFPVINNAVDVTISSVPPGDYTVTIQAIGAGGTATITGTPFSILGAGGGGGTGGGEGDTVPGAPLNVVATALNARASIAFSPPTSDGGDPIIGYTATASTGQTGSASSSPVGVDVPNDVPVTFTVRATNNVGTGPASAPSNQVTPSAPPVQIAVPLLLPTGGSVGVISGLRWAWFDETTPDQFNAPTDQGGSASTDLDGVLTVSLPNTSLTTGQVGWLIVTNSDGTPAMAHKAFSGPVTVL